MTKGRAKGFDDYAARRSTSGVPTHTIGDEQYQLLAGVLNAGFHHPAITVLLLLSLTLKLPASAAGRSFDNIAIRSLKSLYQVHSQISL